MKKTFITATAILCSIVASAGNTVHAGGTVIAPTDSCIQYIGRICFDNPLQPAFNLPGTQIRARFEGTSLKLMARPQSGYFMAQIDNAEPFKISFNTDADSVVTIATALPEGIHSVNLMYITEGLFRNPEFRGFVLDSGCRLTPPAPLPARRIEFIGNSITCGYGNEAADGNEHYSDATENHYYSFASLTARRLDAIHVTVARSGAGVYRNYAGPSTGSTDCLPTFYESTLYHKKECKWDFNRYRPHVVCVNLGTNDLSTDGFDEQLFKDAYRRFILTIRQNNPQAVIIMLSGPMLSAERSKPLHEIQQQIVKENETEGRIFMFSFPPQTGERGYGADWHPSMSEHRHMADLLAPFISKVTGWQETK